MALRTVMPTAEANRNNRLAETPEQKYQRLVRRVAERVWQLWREELRRSRERRGGQLRG